MPAYNEQDAIGAVLGAWARELERLGIDYELTVYDDGSIDRTAEVAAYVSEQGSRVVVVRQANRGHGPTIVRGYREARGEWIFQVDSDGEIAPDSFEDLWRRRRHFDLALGYRVNRRSGLARRLVTATSRLAVRVLFGHQLRDVNTPYRLIRRSAVAAFLPSLDGVFAPNVIMSGLAARAGLRILEVPVEHLGRRTGTASITSIRLWNAAFRSALETIAAAVRHPAPPQR